MNLYGSDSVVVLTFNAWQSSCLVLSFEFNLIPHHDAAGQIAPSLD